MEEPRSDDDHRAERRIPASADDHLDARTPVDLLLDGVLGGRWQRGEGSGEGSIGDTKHHAAVVGFVRAAEGLEHHRIADLLGRHESAVKIRDAYAPGECHLWQ